MPPSPYSPACVEGVISDLRLYGVLGKWTQPPQVIARKEKMIMSCNQWMSHAQRDPPVSSMLLPSRYPKNVAKSTP